MSTHEVRRGCSHPTVGGYKKLKAKKAAGFGDHQRYEAGDILDSKDCSAADLKSLIGKGAVGPAKKPKAKVV